MNISPRSVFLATALLVAVPAIAPQGARAQTPSQMEYERQQREYRQQQEQQRQEQQRQQQLMNENARRQQEESRRLNAPTGQSPTPGYQGVAPQAAPRQSRVQETPPVVTTATDWASTCSSQANGGTDIYIARSTISKSGDLVKMWDMFDFKSVQTADDKRYFSTKNQHEYDCKRKRLRMLSTTGFSGRMGKGAVVAYSNTPFPWEPVPAGGYAESCYWKQACEKK